MLKKVSYLLRYMDEADDSPSIELVWFRKSPTNQRFVVLMVAWTSTWESIVRWYPGRCVFCEVLPYVHRFKIWARLMSSGEMVREIFVPR
jgi:hypothetical protein